MKGIAIIAILVAGALGITIAQQDAIPMRQYQPSMHTDGQYLANGLLPPVPVPIGDPLTDAKIRLGQQLYFDTRLSADKTISCASCHDPNHGWADKTPVSSGIEHKTGGRNSPTVLNAVYNNLQFWDGRASSLEDQALGPIQNPVEMGMTMNMALDRLFAIQGYMDEFQDVFGGPPTAERVASAIAAFERTVISTDSPYDRYIQGDLSAMNSAAIRGMKIFNGKGHCTPCHSGPNFTDNDFHNIGIGYKNGKFDDMGRYIVTKIPKDIGAFKTPTLRSVALTPPYMHDGSEPTLEAVIDTYNRGGIPNPNLDRLILPTKLTKQEKADLVEYLKALTGQPVKLNEVPMPE